MNILSIYAHPNPSSFNAALSYRSAEWIVMKKGILYFCEIRNIKRSVFQSVKNSKQEKREKWLQKIYEKAAKL